MSPKERLHSLRSKSEKERKNILHNLTSGCPIEPWPFGMPSSASPHIVLLGVSPGNRPKAEDRGLKTDRQAFGPPTFGTVHSGFLYDDPGRYWQKARDLCQFLILRDDAQVSSDDALALSAHLNLGTGQHGQAGAQAIERDILEWVSQLLYSQFNATVLVCFGLSGILMSNRNSMAQWWNCNGGLLVNWQCPLDTSDFTPYKYKLRLWAAERKDGGRMAVLMWPNHPSRHPFSGGPDSKCWQLAKHQANKLLTQNHF